VLVGALVMYMMIVIALT